MRVMIISLLFTAVLYSSDTTIAEHAKRLAYHHLSISKSSPHGHVYMRLAYTLNPNDSYVLKLNETLTTKSSSAYLPPIAINRSSSRILAALLYEDLLAMLKQESLSVNDKRKCILYAKLISFCNNDTTDAQKHAQAKALKFGDEKINTLLKTIPRGTVKKLPSSPRTVYLPLSKTTIPPSGITAIGPNKIVVTCDNVYTLYVNGKLIGTDNNWETADTYKMNLDPGMVITAVAEDGGNGTTVGFACLVYDSKKAKSTPHGWYYKTEKPADGWKQSKNVKGWKALNAIHKPKRPITNIKGLEKSNWAWCREKQTKLYLKFIN